MISNPLLLKDYIDFVGNAYHVKRENNQLSTLLSNPTTANIRLECINVFQERIAKGHKIEENTLRGFFGVPREGEDFGHKINRSRADEFKPIQSIIKKKVKNPSIENVELLAWLIDFTPRPLAIAQKRWEQNEGFDFLPTPAEPQVEEETKETMENEIDGTKSRREDHLLEEPLVEDETGDKTTIITKGGNGKKWKGIAAVITAIAISGTSLLLFNKNKDVGPDPLGSSLVCMYWNGDQYEEAPCSKAGIVKMEKEKIRTFRRIRDERSITEEAIGKVHYIKDGEIKYYTEAGRYPDDTSRTLKKLTRYMYDKYLRKKDTTRENDLARQP